MQSGSFMEFYVVDAFTDHIFGGNQAGVVILRGGQPFPEDSLMLKIAAELKHSETAFVQPIDKSTYTLRYFTPVDAVPLCGHATISAFTVLRQQQHLACGSYIAQTKAGELTVIVEPDRVWLRMPAGELIKTLTSEEAGEVYRAYGLSPDMATGELAPCVVHSGLADILVPVDSREHLNHALQNRDEVIRLSKRHNGVGVHLYYFAQDGAATAYCRNFAPLFGIDEESATGTSNAALTHYLYTKGKIAQHSVNTIVQGEAMGRKSVILSRVDEDGNIWIGGGGVVLIQGEIKLKIF
jgi:PhzF family phenazine biosynthesis protein